MRIAPGVWLTLLFAALASCSPAGGEARDVLVVTLDTTRADHLGAYGAGPDATPHLDAFAGQSVLFEYAVAPVPVTMPSHSTMFTGLQPYRHGVRYNLMFVLPDEQITLAEVLGDAGFATGAVVSSAMLSPRFGLHQGFDSYADVEDIEKGRTVDEQPERTAEESVDLAIEWWRDHRGSRRLLWLHLWDPHFPYTPPFPFSSRYEERPYAGEIAYADHQLGRLFDALREDADWDRTLIVVVGDHGEGLYEHGERWHADLVYESTMHPPLLVKPPRWEQGRRIGQPVSLADVAPTVADFVGVDGFTSADGISLRETIVKGEAPLRAIYFESLADNLIYGWSALRGVRWGRFKYIEGSRAELYDLDADPGETTNLAGDDPGRARALSAMLAEHRARERDVPEADALLTLDESTLDKLTSLGYVGTSAVSTSELEDAIHPPDQVDLLQELLRVQGLVARGRWEQAAESLDFILARDPRNRSSLYSRARVYMAQGDLERALLAAEALRGLYADSVQALDLVAEILAKMGRPAEAAERLGQAIEAEPENPRLRFHRLLALAEGGRIDEAEPDLEWLEQRRSDHYTVSLARAIVQAGNGAIGPSIASLREATERGLTSLQAVEESPLFDEVRRHPDYARLTAELERAAAQEPSDSGR